LTKEELKTKKDELFKKFEQDHNLWVKFLFEFMKNFSREKHNTHKEKKRAMVFRIKRIFPIL
jgi:hypothetical protein